jgi:hypothetical protein
VDRIAAAKGRVEQHRSFAARVREAGPPCLDCRYRTLLGTCGNPAYAKQAFDPARGAYSERFETRVSVARSDDGLCGPEALLFEPRNALVAIANGLGQGAWNVLLSIAAVLFGLGVLWMLLGR